MPNKKNKSPIQKISVIVPRNPFVQAELQNKRHCLCALNVRKLMEWWPGIPHSPNRDSNKVISIQRSLDWRRVTDIAAYLLQKRIEDVPDKLNKYFFDIYDPLQNEPGREWPPRVKKIVDYKRSEFPTFSNILLHVNGAEIKDDNEELGAVYLVFDESNKNLNFSVIDGQHRINGAYLAVCILREQDPNVEWEIPAEVFLDLDNAGSPPRKQAQIFIDVNFYQKKVDRSLVADLFPTARGNRESLDQKERAQDIGRRLMLETGPLVGMIQIPGIRYGIKDVITLATLDRAIEDVIDFMEKNNICGLEMQTDFLAQCLSAWFEASGRFENKQYSNGKELSPENVAYQGRVLVSVITLIPAMIFELKKKKISFMSERALKYLTDWLRNIAERADLIDKKVFIGKDEFKKRKYLGSGGIGIFRDSLWAAINSKKHLNKMKIEEITRLAENNKHLVLSKLQK